MGVLQRSQHANEKYSLVKFMEKTLLRRIFNRILHSLVQSLPGAKSVRPFLHRLRGVKIYGDVFIGDEVYIENEYPMR